MDKISPGVSKAYKKAQDWGGEKIEGVLADALRDTLAELRRTQYLLVNGLKAWVERKDWTDNQWRDLADKELRGE